MIAAEGPAVWVRKMARWLPYHRDVLFMSLQAAVHGLYQRQFREERERVPETVKERANQELDAFRRRAQMAIAHYQQKKRG